MMLSSLHRVNGRNHWVKYNMDQNAIFPSMYYSRLNNREFEKCYFEPALSCCSLGTRSHTESTMDQEIHRRGTIRRRR